MSHAMPRGKREPGRQDIQLDLEGLDWNVPGNRLAGVLAGEEDFQGPTWLTLKSGRLWDFHFQDHRIKTEVLVRLRNETDKIEPWKLAFAWTAVRRCVLDVFQKRSQETRLRDQLNEAKPADYPSLSTYVADFELRCSKLAAHGTTDAGSTPAIFWPQF